MTPIDGCTYSFDELCSEVLPDLFETLREAIVSPFPASWIKEPNVGVSTVLKRLGFERDFSGCYVFADSNGPFYVGISRGVVGRLFQHINSSTHYGGSLAYHMAKAEYDPGFTRDQNMRDPVFRQRFTERQQKLESSNVAMVRVENALVRYLFEAYASMKLGTGKYNTFETH